MDWVNQNKFRNWLIVVLFGLNIILVSIVWMQTANRNEPQRKKQDGRASESVQLMKRALDLTEEQTDQLQKIQRYHLDQLKTFNDRLNELKMQLAEELFAKNPDTSVAAVKAKEIGELQEKVELLRFKHFFDILAICTSEQKEKLKPIVTEIIGRKPPKDESAEKNKRGEGQEEKKPRDKNMRETTDEKPQRPPDGKPEPPAIEEKVTKYTERLNLTNEQVQKLRAVFLKTKQKGEELRTRINPNRDEIQSVKERIRKEEDESIMKILTGDQKMEFEKMISNRRQ